MPRRWQGLQILYGIKKGVTLIKVTPLCMLCYKTLFFMPWFARNC